MDPADFRRHGHALVDWIAEYLAGSERYPVLPRVSPGDVRRETGLGAGLSNVTSFGESLNGEVYVLAGGTLYRFQRR